MKIDIGNIATSYVNAADNPLAILSGKKVGGNSEGSKITLILNKHHNAIVERLAMMKSSMNLTAGTSSKS